jgi:hypothetical protein
MAKEKYSLENNLGRGSKLLLRLRKTKMPISLKHYLMQDVK